MEERAFDVVVLVYYDVVVRQNLRYGQPVFYVGDLHLKNILKFYLIRCSVQRYTIKYFTKILLDFISHFKIPIFALLLDYTVF